MVRRVEDLAPKLHMMATANQPTFFLRLLPELDRLTLGR